MDFGSDVFFPRAAGAGTWHALTELHGDDVASLCEVPLSLRKAQFHPAGAHRVTEAELIAWRVELNEWAESAGFPEPLNAARRNKWDVALGGKLLEATHELPEAMHPDIWCWLATHLLPHFVVYRWGWPAANKAEAPSGREAWARFGSTERNALRLAAHRIGTYGSELATMATEQEFQSILNRPAFGLDQRVGRVVLHALVDAFESPNSTYGKRGGTRALDANDVCIELRLINSLRPLCFFPDAAIADIVNQTIERLPELRRETTIGGEVSTGLPLPPQRPTASLPTSTPPDSRSPGS